MKKALSILLCLILVLGCFPLTAMADDTTIDGNGETSISLTLTVPEPVVLDSITVTSPTKTEYNVGDSLDTAGMVVTANYTDESTKDVTSLSSLSGFDSSTAGEVTVTVSYTEGEKTVTATFTVTIVTIPEQATVYTVTVEPGEGSGTAFTVQSTTVISQSEMVAGNYDQTKGCFYDGGGTIFYRLPQQCSFIAPDGQEFDYWLVSSSQGTVGTWSSGGSIDIASSGNLTVTAYWKAAVPQSSVTLSIPASIDVKYGDTQTAFDIQVKEAVFANDLGNFEVLFPYSSFQCTSHDGTIPFTVTTNAAGVPNGHHGDRAYFVLFNETRLPFNCQGFINITSDDWAAAKPGNYTATLRVQVEWIN